MGLSVLIVDDEKVFRNFIADMSLWKKGKFVLAGEARNTDEAMRFLERHEVSAVIMDVSMPGKNGVVLSEMIAGKYPQIAMVAVSSYDDYDYVRQILKNGAQDYILKSRLSEEMLERTLEGIETRIEQISPWEIKKELRCQTVQWLMNNGISPFTSDNSRKVVSLAKVQLRKKYSDAGYNAMMEGIGRIFEDGTTEKMDVLAIPAQQGRFVLINRFYEEVSEAKIREKVENSQMISLDNIRRVYDVTVLMQVCPPFFSDKAMRSFILHKLEEKGTRTLCSRHSYP